MYMMKKETKIKPVDNISAFQVSTQVKIMKKVLFVYKERDTMNCT